MITIMTDKLEASKELLTRYYQQASPAAFEAGLQWYFEAHKLMASDAHGFPYAAVEWECSDVEELEE
jgi:hypothetical protein